jgi:hypothetical protein
MARVDEKGYAKYTDICKHAYQSLKTAIDMRDDLYVVILTHSENTGDNLNPYYKIKTQGKMTDTVITLEGLFEYVFFTRVLMDESNKVQYKFLTNSDGTCTAKTPMGMFDDLFIENDLKLVIDTINKYDNED